MTGPLRQSAVLDIKPPFLVGVIHLPALPGAPRHQWPLPRIVDQAVTEGRCLHEAGFDAAIIENFGDVPFSPDRLESASVAAMAIVTDQVHRAVPISLGINALRNDALAALGIAAAAGADFIRVNVHTGVAATDQGVIEGQADETLRYRQRLGEPIAIFADVHVKHAVPISQPDLALAAEETAYRGLADVLIITGVTTGRAADLDQVRVVKGAVPDRPVLIGSGVAADTVAAALQVADGVIVGTALRPGGRYDQTIDAQLAQAFVRAAGR